MQHVLDVDTNSLQCHAIIPILLFRSSTRSAQAAADTCPMLALEQTAALDWTVLAKPGVPPAAFADAEVFRDLVTVVKVCRSRLA